MANNPSAARAVVKGLLNLLKARMPSIVAAYDDFPSSSQQLKFPSFSIFTQQPKHTPRSPYVVKILPKIVGGPNDGRAPVLYCVGATQFSFQVDLWCSSKPQRHQIYEEFIQAMNDLEPTAGVNLKLTDYYDEWIHADFSDVSFTEDAEASTQRNEWRLKVDVVTEVRVLKQKMESLMETIESTVEPTEGGSI